MTPVGIINAWGIVILYIFYWKMRQKKLEALKLGREYYGQDIDKKEFFDYLTERSHFEEWFPYLFVAIVIFSLVLVYRYLIKRDTSKEDSP